MAPLPYYTPPATESASSMTASGELYNLKPLTILKKALSHSGILLKWIVNS